jgi:hypothetical protein
MGQFEQFDVDVEYPLKGVTVMSLNEVVRKFNLTDGEIQKLNLGQIVWAGEVALSRSDV